MARITRVLTLIASQPDKLGGAVLARTHLVPELYANMAKAGTAMTPYVYTLGDTLYDGIMDFLETPRYSTG